MLEVAEQTTTVEEQSIMWLVVTNAEEVISIFRELFPSLKFSFCGNVMIKVEGSVAYISLVRKVFKAVKEVKY